MSFPREGSPFAAVAQQEIGAPGGILHVISGGDLARTSALLVHGMSSAGGRWIDAGVSDALIRAGRNWLA